MPMNWFMALNVVCCDPVAVSPEIWVRPLRRLLPDRLKIALKALERLAPPSRALSIAPATFLLIGGGVARQDRREQAGIERQQHVVADIAQHRIAGEIVGDEQIGRSEGAVQRSRTHDGVGGLPGQPLERIDDDLAGDVGGAGDDRPVADRAGDLHQIGGRRRHGQARGRDGARRVAGRQRAVDDEAAEGAVAAQRAVRADDDAGVGHVAVAGEDAVDIDGAGEVRIAGKTPVRAGHDARLEKPENCVPLPNSRGRSSPPWCRRAAGCCCRCRRRCR